MPNSNVSKDCNYEITFDKYVHFIEQKLFDLIEFRISFLITLAFQTIISLYDLRLKVLYTPCEFAIGGYIWVLILLSKVFFFLYNDIQVTIMSPPLNQSVILPDFRGIFVSQKFLIRIASFVRWS